MAGKSTEQAEIEELIRISEEARGDLGVKITKLRRTLEAPTRIVGSLRSHPKFWLFGSMAAGIGASLLLGRLPRRKKKGSGLKKMAIGLTLTAARPLAKVWITNQLKSLGGKWIAERTKPKPSPFKIEPDPYPEDVRTPGP